MLAARPLSRDAAGLFYVAAIALGFGPTILALVGTERSFWLVFVAAFGVYAGLAAWATIATAAYGNQVHYLIIADHNAKGSLDATVDGSIFFPLVGALPNAAAARHTSSRPRSAPVGPRDRALHGPPGSRA